MMELVYGLMAVAAIAAGAAVFYFSKHKDALKQLETQAQTKVAGVETTVSAEVHAALGKALDVAHGLQQTVENQAKVIAAPAVQAVLNVLQPPAPPPQ